MIVSNCNGDPAPWQDPEIGRWLSVDPLAEQYPSFLPYIYAGNNPVNLFDPNGMEIRGNSADLAVAANLINEAIGDKNIENAKVTVKSKQVEKTGISVLIAKIANALGIDVSTTETVYYLAAEGEGWNNLQANDPRLSRELNSMATQAFNMLKDLIEMPDVINFVLTETYKGIDLSLGFGGGKNDPWSATVYLSPKGNLNPRSSRYGESPKGIFFHEVVGHTHPESFDAAYMNVIFNYQPFKRHEGPYPTYNRLRIRRRQ